MLWNSNKRLDKYEEAFAENELRRKIQEIVKWDKERLRFTPDYLKLSQQLGVLLFIHDDMMQLQPNHDLVKIGSLSGFYPFMYGYTSQRLSFVKKELGLHSFPVAIDIRDTDELQLFMAEKHRIRGEIYAIRPQQMIELDTHRQNGVQFQRITANINIGFQKLFRRDRDPDKGRHNVEYQLGKEEMITVPMQMYVGREAYWLDQLKAGFFDFSPITIITEDRLWLKEYYQYSRVR